MLEGKGRLGDLRGDIVLSGLDHARNITGGSSNRLAATIRVEIWTTTVSLAVVEATQTGSHVVVALSDSWQGSATTIRQRYVVGTYCASLLR